MKKVLNLILFLIITFLNSCQKEKKDIFIGSWISINPIDTLFFISDQKLERSANSAYHDRYNYSYTADSLTLQYDGPDKILVHSEKFKYQIEQNTLTIDFKDGYYPKTKTGLIKYLKK